MIPGHNRTFNPLIAIDCRTIRGYYLCLHKKLDENERTGLGARAKSDGSPYGMNSRKYLCLEPIQVVASDKEGIFNVAVFE